MGTQVNTKYHVIGGEMALEEMQAYEDMLKAKYPERIFTSITFKLDGEYVDVQLRAGQITKTELPIGQHLLEFLSTENPNVKVEKMVDFPESGKNYLVVVNELKAAVAPPMPQGQPQQAAPQNPFLDQLNQMQWNNPLMPPPMPGMPQMPPPMPGDNNK